MCAPRSLRSRTIYTGTATHVYVGDCLRLGYTREAHMYEEVGVLETHHNEYNATNTGQLALVFFNDAVQHIIRLTSVLAQPRCTPTGQDTDE